MPLIKSGSKDAIAKNISAEREAGKKPSQAVAIALDVARRAKRADGGSVNEELRPYEPYSWRGAITDKLKDFTQNLPWGIGDNRAGMAAAQTTGDILSALIAPIGVQHGAVNLREGLRSGNNDRAIEGALDVALGVAPYGVAAVAPKMTARGAFGEYKAANAPPKKDIWSKENISKGRDRAYDTEKTGNQAVDHQTKLINEGRKARGEQPIDADTTRGAIDALDPLTRVMVKYGGLGNGRPMYMKPGMWALQGANAAGWDYLMDGGFMPWSWNREGTVQNEARRIWNEPEKTRVLNRPREEDIRIVQSADPVTRYVTDLWNNASVPNQIGVGAMAAAIPMAIKRKLWPLAGITGIGGAGTLAMGAPEARRLSRAADAWKTFERGSDEIVRDPLNYANGGSVSPADEMLRGYADGGAPDWRSDMDAPRPHYDPVTGEWIEPKPRVAPVLRAPDPGSDPTRTLGERALDSLLQYGPLPAKMATAIAMQPATAGLATGEALADPTLPNITNAGVQTAMAAFRPMMALKALGLGYGAAGASDLGLLPFGSAKAQDDGLSDTQRRRLDALQKKGALSRAEREEKNALVQIQADASRIEREAKAQAALRGTILDKELETKKKSDEQAEYNRAVDAADRGLKEKVEAAKGLRFDESEVGKLYRKTGIITPGLAAMGAGALSRGVTGGGTFAKDWGLPVGTGAIIGGLGVNYPELHEVMFQPADNPEKTAYSHYARDLPPTHPRKQEWTDYAVGLEKRNPIRDAAIEDLMSPSTIGRTVFGVAEGASGGKLGALMSRIPGRAVDIVTGLPGRVREGYQTGMAKADLAARDALAARRLLDQEREASRALSSGEAEVLGRTSGLKALEDQSGAAARPGPSRSSEAASSPTSVPPKAGIEGSAIDDALQSRLSAPEQPTVIVKTPRKSGGWHIRKEDGKFASHPSKKGKDETSDGKKAGGAVKSALGTARKYASGGAVLAGPVIGDTGGREDALPVDVGHGSYVIPSDIVASLGENNTLAGMKKLEQAFSKPMAQPKAAGGEVPILISDGEFVVSPEQVAKLGGGNMEKGHKVLDALVGKLRQEHIKTLKSLPGPAKG